MEALQLLNERQVSTILGISIASLRRWRLLGTGPRFIKVGASVRYLPDDVTAWLQSRPSGGEHFFPTGKRETARTDRRGPALGDGVRLR